MLQRKILNDAGLATRCAMLDMPDRPASCPILELAEHQPELMAPSIAVGGGPRPHTVMSPAPSRPRGASVHLLG